MNLLTVIVVVYLLIETLLGGKRGFFKSIVALLVIGAAMFFSMHCSPQVAKAIKDNTDIDELLEERIEEGLELPKSQNEMGSRSWQKEQLDNSGFPDCIKRILEDNSNQEFFRALGAESFCHYIAGYITGIILNSIAYLLTFVGIWLLFHIMARALGLVFELPILNGLNRVGGALFGLAKGILVLLLFFVILTMFGSNQWGQTVIQAVEESPVLFWLYENNPLMDVVTDITKLIF